ncbi:O-antigen ligase domain-containing protein, partial [Pseudonocardia sp. KRD-169]|nr:O-antigen ligase domain-containing protein [Pseudonocardia abyssalis]
MASPDQTVTAPLPTIRPRRAAVGGALALLCLAAVLLDAAADLLPDDPLAGVLTPLRLVVLLGLAALAVARPVPVRTPFDLPVALLLVAAAVATALNGQPWSGWRAVLTGAAVLYLTAGVRRVVPGAWPALALLALLGVGVAATAAARQSANGTGTGFCRGALDGSADLCTGVEMIRATGTFANPNLLAAFLVLLLPIAAAGATGLADRASRLVGTAVVVVGYAALLLTGSRGGVLAAVAGVTAFVV